MIKSLQLREKQVNAQMYTNVQIWHQSSWFIKTIISIKKLSKY